jgi:putative DNA-invertase from lambdoid prophage Rac
LHLAWAGSPIFCQAETESAVYRRPEQSAVAEVVDSKLVFTILSAVAEAERDRIRERVTQVKRDQRQRNRYLGGIVPFGYRAGDDGGLVPEVAEQALIAHARALRAGGATLRAIQAALRVQHGRNLSLDALHRVLAVPEVVS